MLIDLIKCFITGIVVQSLP